MLAVLLVAMALDGCGMQEGLPPKLIENLSSTDPAIRRGAVEKLSVLNSKAASEGAIRALKDQDRGVRITAAGALAKRGTDAAIDALISALQDKDMWVRSSASDALAESRSKKCIEPLLELIDTQAALKPKGIYTTEEYGQDINSAAFALRKITGVDFGFDTSRWRKWFNENASKPAQR